MEILFSMDGTNAVTLPSSRTSKVLQYCFIHSYKISTSIY